MGNAADDVTAQATFAPANAFGQVVNGEPNPMFIQITNGGENEYTIVGASASYHDTDKDWKLVKNATVTKLNLPLVAGGNLTAPYNLNSEFRPQELGLTVWVDLKHGKEFHRVTAFNSTVSVVEPAASWFDPGVIFAYLVVGAALLGGAYAIFTSYFAPQQPRKGKGGRKATKAAPAVVEGTVSDASGRGYDEDWIPVQHRKKDRKDGGAASGGEATSGAESGPEKTRRRKARK